MGADPDLLNISCNTSVNSHMYLMSYFAFYMVILETYEDGHRTELVDES